MSENTKDLVWAIVVVICVVTLLVCVTALIGRLAGYEWDDPVCLWQFTQ